MPRLFVPDSALQGDRLILDGPAATHLAGSLRVRPGDTIRVVDESGMEHTVAVEKAAAELLGGRVIRSDRASGEARLRVHVVQALAKDGMDEAVDAAVQAGAAAIHPVVTERTVVRLDGERAQRRTAHWQAVARETAQLAFRARIPDVHGVASLDTALQGLPEGTRLLACVISDNTQALGDVALEGCDDVAICIGPEGGFSPADLEVLRRHGATDVHLGPRVFRSRLAAAIATTLLLHAAGELSGARSPVIDGDQG